MKGEFFEKKKLDLKCEKLQKASYCHSGSKKKKLSQDLVALRTVSNTSVKAGNSPRSVKVQHVDLGRHHAAGVSRRSGDHRSALGSCLSQVPENVELPFSPDHLPSKLLLQEPVMPSHLAFQMADLNPVTPRTPKENEDPFHTPKRMRAQHSPHRHPPPQTSLSDRYTISTATKTSNKNAYGFQAPSSTVHTDARFTNPWMPEEDFKLFNMKKIHEKFQSPLFASQELEELDTLPSSDHATTATRRQVTPLSVDVISRYENPPKVLQASQDLLHRRADHDDRQNTHQDHNHCRSKSALIQPADSQHNLKLSQPCSTPPDSTADEDDVKLHIAFNSQSSEAEGSLDLDASVLGPGDCSDAESDPDSGVQDAVEFLVHQVVMEENRNSLADVLTADKGQTKTLWSDSETLDKRSTFLRQSPMSVTNSNHAGNGGQSQRDKHYASVHVQTDWTLLHADIPSNWLPGAPVAVTIWVDRETQWELPPTQLGAADIQPCMESTNPPSEQHRAASPAEEETQTEPAPTPTDKKIVEVEIAGPATTPTDKKIVEHNIYPRL
ncbi:hypothetical protein ACOMHN_041312 [Nucella lapillus]